MGYVGVLGGLVLLACFADEAIGQPASSEDKSIAAQPLAADRPMATTNVATFRAPLGWSVIVNANMVLLAPPEGDSRLALVDVRAPDAAAAVAAGWASYRPDANRPLSS